MKLNLIIVPLLLIPSYSLGRQKYIEVFKKEVLHRFVYGDDDTNHFTQNVFADWENDTFDVFSAVKDPKGIAIDIGAWIGTTAIWLSKNFYHVVAVEADTISVDYLKRNLQASECPNVSICERPVAHTSEMVIFGPRWDKLNLSISHIKPVVDKTSDYSIQAITFKQIIHDFVYSNKDISDCKISFIKCDIEGGEEDILEDLLHFAYHNKANIYLSFHLDWWRSKKITDFEYLFKFFDTNCPQPNNVCGYLKKNPFASLLLRPRTLNVPFIKKNIPAVIIGYNQYTYIKNMVEQLEPYTSDIIVIDNNSSYEPLLNYYKHDFKYTLLVQPTNIGYCIYQKDWVHNLTGDIFLLTDPDLAFNPKLPKDFIQNLIAISNHFQATKVGFALEIDSHDINNDLKYGNLTVKEWESAFWQKQLKYPRDTTMVLYSAAVDTTFCLVNKKWLNPQETINSQANNIRVAGDYTCKHLPWYNNFQDCLECGEYEAYMNNNKSTSWCKK